MNKAELIKVLKDLLANYDEETQTILVEPDAGCFECTVGTVPNNRNTGPCPYHKGLALIKQTSEEASVHGRQLQETREEVSAGLSGIYPAPKRIETEDWADRWAEAYDDYILQM